MSKLIRLSLRSALVFVCLLSLSAIDFNASGLAQSNGLPAASKQLTRKKKRRRARRIATRREIVTERSKVTITSNQSPPAPTVVGNRDVAPSDGLTLSTGNATGEASVSPQPTPLPKDPISGGVLNGKAVILPKPAYPAMARAARASGTVVVQIIIDEEGNVISAKAVSGHPLLQAAAVDAAREAKFTPTKLYGQPVKVTGVITYNFIAD